MRVIAPSETAKIILRDCSGGWNCKAFWCFFGGRVLIERLLRGFFGYWICLNCGLMVGEGPVSFCAFSFLLFSDTGSLSS